MKDRKMALIGITLILLSVLAIIVVNMYKKSPNVYLFSVSEAKMTCCYDNCKRYNPRTRAEENKNCIQACLKYGRHGNFSCE